MKVERPGANGNAYSSSKMLYNKIRITESKIIEKSTNEAIDWEVADDEKGGMIILSRTVNAIPSSKNKAIN